MQKKIKKVVAITGYTGTLGRKFIDKYKQFSYKKINFNISNKSKISNWIKKNEFDFFIHFAAIVPTYKVLKNKNKLSIILFRPLTGKTHQLRIVSKHLNCPIIGDMKYSKQKKSNSEKLKLNAFFLQFVINSEKFEFKSELPNHFKEFLKKNKIELLLNKNLNYLLYL